MVNTMLVLVNNVMVAYFGMDNIRPEMTEVAKKWLVKAETIIEEPYSFGLLSNTLSSVFTKLQDYE